MDRAIRNHGAYIGFILKEQMRLFFNSIMGRSIEIKDADNSRIQDRLILFAEIYRNIEHDIYDLENLQYTSFCLMHF